MDKAEDLLKALPPHEGKLMDSPTYSPVNVKFVESTGIIFLGILAIMLFSAYKKLQAKYEALLKNNLPE